MRILFQYYIVLRSCWPVLLFQAIGIFALVFFAQGQDVLRELQLHLKYPADFRHSVLAWIGALWWGWQSWRASRMLLHFSNFSFWNYRALYILRAQVLLPRVLGIFPPLILAWGLYRAKGYADPLFYLMLSGTFWLYIFYHFRRPIIVFIRSRRKFFFDLIPDYIPVKNASYPARFMWRKQRLWIAIRIVMLAVVFGVVYFSPVAFPQWIGATAVIISAFGFWLVIISMSTILEHYFHAPLLLALIVLAGVFSFFNNNHQVRSITSVPNQRTELEQHFLQWAKSRTRNQDTFPVFLVASEGGGIRSAYWTSRVLSLAQEQNPDFKHHVFALTGVSGGSLGVAMFAGAMRYPELPDSLYRQGFERFSRLDFLAPVSAWAVYPDMLQRFLPFPVEAFDRAKALEYSWEKGWMQCFPQLGSNFMQAGFLEQMDVQQHPDLPVLILNTTHVESGNRCLISNVKLPHDQFFNAHQLFDITGHDIPVSTAISCSSRFPFITPPAAIKDSSGKRWGHLVDGGYFENLGSATLLETYFSIRKTAKKHRLPVKFVLLLIRNTHSDMEQVALPGFYELIAPPYTFARIWQKSGLLGIRTTEKFMLENGDEILNIQLSRSQGDLLPLGWSLSRDAVRQMEAQTQTKSDMILEKMH